MVSQPGVGGPSSRSYRLMEQLGRGGFGTVWRGQLVGGSGFVKQVAIKLLNAETGDIAEIAQRLRDEARILALLRHRAIVGVDDLVQIDGRWAVVMEFIDGADLQNLMQLGPVPARPACEIGREAAAALRAAHEAVNPETRTPVQIVHRDIKPANIRVTAGGEVKVLDFGVARAQFDRREAQTRSMAFGSMGYMSPERFDGLDTPPADVYALGVVLLESLSGSPVGQLSVNPRTHGREVERAMAGLPAGTEALGPLIRRMLAYDPDERPRSAEVARTLQDLTVAVRGPWLADWAADAVSRARGEDVGPPNVAPDSSDSLARARPAVTDPATDDEAGSTRAVIAAARAASMPPAVLTPEERPGTVAMHLPAPAVPTPSAPPARSQSGSVAVEAARPPPAQAPDDFTGAHPTRSRIPWLLAGVAASGLVAIVSVGAAVFALSATEGEDQVPPTVAALSDAVAVPEPPVVETAAEPPSPVPSVPTASSSSKGRNRATASSPPSLPSSASASPPASGVPENVEAARQFVQGTTTPTPAESPPGPVEAKPSPTGTPATRRAEANAGTGGVSVSGDASEVWLIGQDGKRRRPASAVPVGVYDLSVIFPSGTAITRSEFVRVEKGATVTIRCSAAVESCR